MAPPVWRWTLRLVTVPLLLVHLAQDPRTLWSTAAGMRGLNGFLMQAASTLPSDPAVRSQQAVILTSPSHYFTFYASTYQALRGLAIPSTTLTLATGFYPVEVHRGSARSLTVRPQGGFLMPPGTVPAGESQPRSSFNYFLQTFDVVFRADVPFQVGQRFDLGRVSAEVTVVTQDGRPAEVTFHFDTDLEDTSWRWLQWQGIGFEPWQPPAVDETLTLPKPW